MSDTQENPGKPKSRTPRPRGNTRKHSMKEQVLYFDPSWRFADLPDLAKRVLTLEIANPGITVKGLMQLAKYEGDLYRFYDLRKLPLYQKLLAEARKNEFELVQEAQVEAAKEIRKLLRSSNERIRFEAAKFVLGHTRDIALKKAEMELAREAAAFTAKNPVRHIVDFRVQQPLPLMGVTVMTEDGRFVPRDSDEGKAIINGEQARTVEKTTPTPSPGLPTEPVHLVLKGYQPIDPDKLKPVDEDDDDGVTLCGAIKDD